MPATTSYLLDRCARITRLFGGLAFTGSGKHFVRYRDEAAPLGYDLQALSSDGGDFIIYNDSFTQSYTRWKELPLDQLLLRLSLRRLPGPDPTPPDEPVWVVAQPGLGRSVIGYLWRNHVEAHAAEIGGDGGSDGSAGSAFGARGALWVVRVARMPSRIRRLFTNMPGVELHRAVSGECLVEVGFRHPVRLEACAAALDKTRFYIFSGTRDTVDVLAAPPPLTPAASLFDSDYALRRETPQRGSKGAASRAPSPKPVGLGLAATPGLPRRVAATLIEWRHVGWLRQLVYTLPAALLDGARAAALDEGFLVLGGAGQGPGQGTESIESLPLGRFFYEAAPSVLVPFGFEVVPRLSPEVLAEHVGGTDGRIVLFVRHATAPVVVLATDLEPLSRRTVVQLDIPARGRDERFPKPAAPVDVDVANEPLALFPLWGFARRPRSDAGEPAALPAHSTFDDRALTAGEPEPERDPE